MKTALKRICEYISKNILAWLTYALCVTVFVVFYREIVGINGTAILIAIFVSYGFCMILNFVGLQKFVKNEKAGTLTFKKIFGLTFLILSPIYWCWIILSIVPISTYEVWFITGFPISIISFLPIKEVAEYWKDKKTAFWMLQVSIYLLFLVTEQAFIRYFI